MLADMIDTFFGEEDPTKIPTLHVDLEYIRGLLTRDSICRKLRRWKMLSELEMDDMMVRTKPWLTGSYNNFKHDAICYIVARKYRVRPQSIRTPFSNQIEWKNVEALAVQVLEFRFPLITALLMNFDGRLIAAGGAIVKSLFTNVPDGHLTMGDDIDLFFIDSEVESDKLSEADKRQRYDEWLVSAIDFLANRWFEQNPKHAAVFILRGEFVTTVYLSNLAQNLDIKYQFIHRVYPNIESVLGGFDLGPAMIAFTGEKIVATELGAWSALARTVIVDVSRRSTSFEHRLQKYATLCHVILPGLSANTLPPKLVNLKSVEEVKDILDALVDEQYPKIPDHEGCIQKWSNKDFKRLLVKTAFENGYILGVDFNGNMSIDDLRPAVGILRMPALEIRCPEVECDWDGFDRTWNLRVPKSTEIKYEINPQIYLDYDHAPVLVTSSRIYNPEQTLSDYETNPVWPSLRLTANLKMLNLSKFQGVVSVTIFHQSTAGLINYFDENLECGLGIAKDCLHLVEPTGGDWCEVIKSVLAKSLQQPTIGDWVQTCYAPDDVDYVADRDIVTRNIPVAIEKLTGIRWILTNPGRQWTSSINPIVGNPREWYGSLYRNFRIGNEATETTLRLIRSKPDNVLSIGIMPRDVFNLLLRYIIWANSQQ